VFEKDEDEPAVPYLPTAQASPAHAIEFIPSANLPLSHSLQFVVFAAGWYWPLAQETHALSLKYDPAEQATIWLEKQWILGWPPVCGVTYMDLRKHMVSGWGGAPDKSRLRYPDEGGGGSPSSPDEGGGGSPSSPDDKHELFSATNMTHRLLGFGEGVGESVILVVG
jgi:hypothetical protein